MNNNNILKELINNILGSDFEIKEETNLIKDLGMCSFDAMALLVKIEETYNLEIEIESFSKIKTYKDLEILIKQIQNYSAK